MLSEYRAWDIKEKTMLYDDDTMQYDGKERKNIWVTNRGITYDVLNAHNDYVTVCKNGKKEDFYNSWDYSAFRHKALIIMQASPWFDKKKMRVFVGDILQIETVNHKTIMVVCEQGIVRRAIGSGLETDIPSFYFKRTDGLKSFPIVNNWAGKHDLEIMEIIGNIYANLEILIK